MAWDDRGGRDDDPWNKNARPKRPSDAPPDIDALLGSFLKKILGMFGFGGGSGGLKFGPTAFFSGLVALGVIYSLSGLYTLDQQERGVVLRFGALQPQLQQPGLRWNPPIVDEVVPVNVTRVENIRHQALMLTEDENIVDVTMSVQYLVADPIRYVVAVRDPRQSLEHAAESALRHVVGSSSMDNVLTEGRERVAFEVQERVQTYMDSYRTGIQVVKVNIDDSQPPTQVAEAFDDVQAAQEDNQRFINEASAYRESIVPRARGEARKQVEQATAYRDQVVARAQGEAQRFDQLLSEYNKAKEVTRSRLYLDTMESIFENTTKIMLDVEGGNNLLYLPLDQLSRAAFPGQIAGQNDDQTVGSLTSDQIRQLTDAVIREVNKRNSASRREGR